MNTVRCAFLQHPFELILIIYVATRPGGPFQTDRVPLDALLILQETPLRDLFFNLNSNIINTSLHSLCHWMPLLMIVIDNFSKALKISQMLVLWTPTLSRRHDVWGSTHATNLLKTKTISITFTEMHETTCFALQVKGPSSLSTDRNKTDVVK